MVELATTTYVFLQLAALQQATTAHQVITRAALGVSALVFTTITQHTRHHTNSGVQVGQRAVLTNPTIQARQEHAINIRPRIVVFIQTPMTLVVLETAMVRLRQPQPIQLELCITATQKQEHGHILKER
jgi:uncharacterized membrane protein